MKIYLHGTSSFFLEHIKINGLLPPSITGILNERRKGYQGTVYLTNSHSYATGYACRTAGKHGGSPVIISVRAEAILERAITGARAFKNTPAQYEMNAFLGITNIEWLETPKYNLECRFPGCTQYADVYYKSEPLCRYHVIYS